MIFLASVLVSRCYTLVVVSEKNFGVILNEFHCNCCSLVSKKHYPNTNTLADSVRTELPSCSRMLMLLLSCSKVPCGSYCYNDVIQRAQLLPLRAVVAAAATVCVRAGRSGRRWHTPHTLLRSAEIYFFLWLLLLMMLLLLVLM